MVTIMPYFTARDIANRFNANTTNAFTYKVVAMPGMKAFIEIWDKQYLIFTL